MSETVSFLVDFNQPSWPWCYHTDVYLNQPFAVVLRRWRLVFVISPLYERALHRPLHHRDLPKVACVRNQGKTKHSHLLALHLHFHLSASPCIDQLHLDASRCMVHPCITLHGLGHLPPPGTSLLHAAVASTPPAFNPLQGQRNSLQSFDSDPGLVKLELISVQN